MLASRGTGPPAAIRLLGRVDVEVGGRCHELSTRTHAGLVLALLSRRANDRVSTDELTEALWMDRRPASYRNVLQVVVSKVRSIVEGGEAPWELVNTGDGYLLRGPRESVDACRFESLVTTAFRALSAGQPRVAQHSLAAALELWAEPFGGAEPDCLRRDADHLRQTRREAASALLEVDVQLGIEDLPSIERAVEDEPLDERRWGCLMIALFRRGRQADALRACRRARHVLAEEVGVEPGPFLRRIEQEILLQQGPSLDPIAGGIVPTRAASWPPPPAALTEVLYREQERAAVRELLAGSRLISLVGPPGVGKTTLAADVARRWTSTPVAWIRLAEVAPSETFVIDIAARLGVVTEADADASTHAAAAAELINDQPVLVVFDNLEHVVHLIVPFVHQLLQSCRNLTVLLTSRRELAVPAERVVLVRPFQADEAGPTLSTAAAYLATRAHVDGSDETDRQALNRIAADLGGLPLGLELAAAQIRRLGVGTVAAHLDVLPLISGHRLDEAISWSVDQLPPASLELFGSLVHLDAPWPLARLIGIGGHLGIDEPAAIVACSTLVEHSLVLTAGERWRILEPVRQHVAARPAPSAYRARLATARAVVDEVERAGRLAEGADQAGGVRMVRELMPDIRRTVAWATAADEPSLAARLLVSLRAAWWTTGLYADGQSLHEVAAPALARWRPWTPADQATSIEARAAIALTRPGFGAPVEHVARLRALLDEAIEADAPAWTIGWVSQLLAAGLAFVNDSSDDAVSVARIALDMAREAADPWLAGWALNANALARGRLEPATALSMLEQSTASFVAAGDRLSAARVSMFRAHGLRIFGITSDSDAALAQARAWCVEVDAAPVTKLDCELGLAQNARADGRTAEAARRFRDLVPQLTAVGDLRCAAAAERELATILLDDGDLDGASALVNHAVETLRVVAGEDTEMAAAALVLAMIAARRAEIPRAVTLLARCRRLASGAGIPLEITQLEAIERLDGELRRDVPDDEFSRLTMVADQEVLW